MTENKRFIRNIVGQVYDSEKDKFFDEDYVGKPIGYEDDLVEFLNEQHEENQDLKFENNELKCALALDGVDYIIAEGKKIDIPPYYEFEQRYDSIMHRREYEGYD